jgi:hypothetical protein
MGSTCGSNTRVTRCILFNGVKVELWIVPPRQTRFKSFSRSEFFHFGPITSSMNCGCRSGALFLNFDSGFEINDLELGAVWQK